MAAAILDLANLKILSDFWMEQAIVHSPMKFHENHWNYAVITVEFSLAFNIAAAAILFSENLTRCLIFESNLTLCVTDKILYSSARFCNCQFSIFQNGEAILDFRNLNKNLFSIKSSRSAFSANTSWRSEELCTIK